MEVKTKCSSGTIKLGMGVNSFTLFRAHKVTLKLPYQFPHSENENDSSPFNRNVKSVGSVT